jgi:hypothetical protein
MTLDNVDHEQDNYAIGLGIGIERAQLLIGIVKEVGKSFLGKNEITLTESMELLVAECTNLNEVAFCVFKFGELSGSSILARMVEVEYGIDTGVRDEGF